MRKLLFPLLALSMIAATPMVSSGPAAGTASTHGEGEAEAPVSEPCLAQTGLDFILTPDGLEEVIDTPMLPSAYPAGLGGEPDPAGFEDAATDVYTVLVDVSPDYTSADGFVRLSWAHQGDIDMSVHANGEMREESTSFNPLDGNVEEASAGRIFHCETFEVHVRNYISQQGDIGIDLSLNGFLAF